MGPFNPGHGLKNLLEQIRNRSVETEPQYGEYDMPPHWKFRKFPGQGMHPAIERMKKIEEPTSLESAIQYMYDEYQNKPEHWQSLDELFRSIYELQTIGNRPNLHRSVKA